MVDKNRKKKTGLHKEISSIFDGVPVPDNQGVSRPHGGPGGPEPSPGGYNSLRPPVRGLQNPQIPSGPGSHQPFRRAPARSAAGGRPKTGAAIRAVDQGLLRQMTKKLFKPKPGVSAGRHIVMVFSVPILLVVFILTMSKLLGTPSPKTTWSAEPRPATPAGQSETEIDWQVPEPYPTTLRDPMQLTAEMTAQIEAEAAAGSTGQTGPGATEPQAGKTGELTVKGILYSEDNPAAVIGARIAHVGDTIAGATIVEITKSSVEFEKDGKRWTQAIEPL